VISFRSFKYSSTRLRNAAITSAVGLTRGCGGTVAAVGWPAVLAGWPAVLVRVCADAHTPNATITDGTTTERISLRIALTSQLVGTAADEVND